MIIYDEKQGTHFIGKEIRTTKHAREQAVEDFRVNMWEADRWIKDNLVKSQFIGVIYGADGCKVRLFGYQRIAFILAVESDIVITIYARHKVDPILRNPLEEIVKNAVKTANSRLHEVERETARTKETLGRLREQAAEALDKSKDETSRIHAAKIIESIDEEIRKQDEALFEARQEHAKLMKGVVAYV